LITISLGSGVSGIAKRPIDDTSNELSPQSLRLAVTLIVYIKPACKGVPRASLTDW